MPGKTKQFLRDDRAASQVEYGMMIALIALVCLLAAIVIGQVTAGTFEKVNDAVRNVNNP